MNHEFRQKCSECHVREPETSVGRPRVFAVNTKGRQCYSLIVDAIRYTVS